MDQVVSVPGPMKSEGSAFRCSFCDTEMVHKVAQHLFPGLATACVDNTTGNPFGSPSAVAVEMRKEMVGYLTQRSEEFVTDCLVGVEGNQGEQKEIPEDPCEIVSDFLEDFAELKRNLVSRVSSWLLSDSREDKIDDFAQEMELNNFWSLERRLAIAEVVLRNIDLKRRYYCPEEFDSQEKLDEHKNHCTFRVVDCKNEGCRTEISARCIEEHDAACPYKIIPCEQNCGETLLRRDMDRHCITACKMKLAKCPFYQIGCESALPQVSMENHLSQCLDLHLQFVLKVIHKKDSASEELKWLATQLEKLDWDGKLLKCKDIKSLTKAVKELEAKLEN